MVILKVIIDAANVAHHGKKDDKPRLKNILSAIDALKNLGYESAIIADASLRHEIDDKDSFKKFLDEGRFHQVPPGTVADHYILKLAEADNAKILSNDFFREYSDEFKDINSRRIPYGLDENDEIKIGVAAKPKKVKNVLQKISTSILDEFELKNMDSYRIKKGKPISGIGIAKEAIDRINRSNNIGFESKLEGFFMKLPLFDKVMGMVEEAERATDFIIFVLVHPKDYKDSVRFAGNIAVTIGDRLKLDHAPLVVIRNDVFTKPGTFELNIIYSEEVIEESPYNVDITINDFDYVFVKKNSRNIASTVASRLGTWKFPIVSVKPSLLLDKPGQFEIFLDKGGKK